TAVAQPIPAAPGLFARLWSLMSQVWGKNGCELDPNGRCLQQGASPFNGCELDPSGRCRADQSPLQKNGCEVDPDGRCIQCHPPYSGRTPCAPFSAAPLIP